jgi:hypothetical protein
MIHQKNPSWFAVRGTKLKRFTIKYWFWSQEMLDDFIFDNAHCVVISIEKRHPHCCLKPELAGACKY